MKIFLDTEFTGLRQHTSLISLGLVTSDNTVFYAEFTDYDKVLIDEWLQNNVIAYLNINTIGKETYKFNSPYFNTIIKGNTAQIKEALLEWLNQFDKVQIWSDCLSYDWVLFNELFGGARKIPSNISYIPMDICTLFELKGINPDIDRKKFSGLNYVNHNALNDAKIIKRCYEKLMEDTVILSKEKYDYFVNRDYFLDCLEANGVNNWIGYGDAQEMYNEEEEE